MPSHPDDAKLDQDYAALTENRRQGQRSTIVELALVAVAAALIVVSTMFDAWNTLELRRLAQEEVKTRATILLGTECLVEQLSEHRHLNAVGHRADAGHHGYSYPISSGGGAASGGGSTGTFLRDVHPYHHEQHEMNPWVPIVLGVLGAALSALAAYAIAKRQRSGKIDTTEASALWAEGQAMRQELRAEAWTLRGEVLTLRNEAVAALNESSAMRIELASLREESLVTHAAMTKLREECAALTEEIVNLRAQMANETESRDALTAKLTEGTVDAQTDV